MKLNDNQEKQVEKISEHLTNLFEKINNNMNELDSFYESLKFIQDELSDFMGDCVRSKEEISDEKINISLNQFESQLNKLDMEIHQSTIGKVGFSEHITNNSPMDIDNQPALLHEINVQEIESLLEKIKKLNNLKISSSFRELLDHIQTSLNQLFESKDQDIYNSCIDVFKDELELLEKQINNCNEAITNIAPHEVPTWDFSQQLQNNVMESSIDSKMSALFNDIEPERLNTHLNIDKITQQISSETRSAVWRKTIDQLKRAVNEANTVEALSTLLSIFEYKLEQYKRIENVLGPVDFIRHNPNFPQIIAYATNKDEVDKIIYEALSNPKENSMVIDHYCDFSLLGSSRTNDSETLEEDDDELALALVLSLGKN